MEISVEHLENHKAKMTVKVDGDQLETARRNTAKRLVKELRIPGFRPGKAPYDVVVSYVGEEALTYEALEDIGNDVYRQALEESKLEPYAQGEITDINLEDGVKMTFVFPKRPSVDLGAYRDIRLEFTPPEVTDRDVEQSLQRTREQLSLGERVDRPAQMNDEVVMDVKGVFAKAETEAEAASEPAAEAEENAEAAAKPEEEAEEVFIDQRQFRYILLDDQTRDMIPGFSQELVGLAAKDKKSFTLTYPESEEDKDLAGRSVNFEVTVNNVNAMIMPEADDFMAELASDGELKTLDALRERLREGVADAKANQSNDEYTKKVLDEIEKSVQITYPEEAVQDFLDELMNDMDEFMQNQVGWKLSDYLRVANDSIDNLREQNRERAIERMRRSLVLTTLAQEEELTVDDATVEAELMKTIASMVTGGVDMGRLMKYLESQGVRERIIANLMTERTMKRVGDIAKGKNPPKGPDVKEGQESNDEAQAETEESAE